MLLPLLGAAVPEVESGQMVKALTEKVIRFPLSAEDLRSQLQMSLNDNIGARERNLRTKLITRTYLEKFCTFVI